MKYIDHLLRTRVEYRLSRDKDLRAVVDAYLRVCEHLRLQCKARVRNLHSYFDCARLRIDGGVDIGDSPGVSLARRVTQCKLHLLTQLDIGYFALVDIRVCPHRGKI